MQLSIADMLAKGMHFGHKKRYCNPEMNRYIHSLRHGVHIIDLSQTKTMLENTMKAVTQMASKGGNILLVGTKPPAQHAIETAAKKVGMPYVNTRWLGGMLTNYKTIRNSVRKLDDLEANIESGKAQLLTKKELLMQLRKYEKLLYNIGGIRKMKGLPDALFVVDVNTENTAITEAKKLGIPVIGIVDTNASPADLEYVIPGNDDSVASIEYYLQCMVSAIAEGQAKIQKPKHEEKPKPKIKVKAADAEAPKAKKRGTKTATKAAAPTDAEKSESKTAKGVADKPKTVKKAKAESTEEKAPKAAAEDKKPVAKPAKKASKKKVDEATEKPAKKTAVKKAKPAAKKQSEDKE